MASKSFGPTAAVADTKTTIGVAYQVPKGGRIQKIRVAAYNGVADKAGTAILILETDRQKGPWEYAVQFMQGLTDVYPVPTAVIDCNIPVSQGEIVTVSLTASEALEDVIVSITWA